MRACSPAWALRLGMTGSIREVATRVREDDHTPAGGRRRRTPHLPSTPARGRSPGDVVLGRDGVAAPEHRHAPGRPQIEAILEQR